MPLMIIQIGLRCKVNNLSDMLLANISETTKENVSELVSCVNDLLLCGAKECNMIKVKHYNKKHTNITPKYKFK